MILPLLVALATLNPVGHVSDFAQLLRPETVANLEETLRNFEARTGSEIAVVTIDTHGSDETIETYAVKLFEKWGIGKKGQDNGLLLLIARDDREMRIEVGYGLEPIITDIESSRIIREVLTPAFQTGDYDGGVTRAIERIMGDIGRGEAPPEKNNYWPIIIFIIIWLILFIIARRNKSKIIWFPGPPRGGGHSSGGGFGGFGGGMSGGGGASGRW